MDSTYDADDIDQLDEIPTDDKLTRVRDLAKLQVQRERNVAILARDLKEAERLLAEVAEHTLPNLLSDLGIKMIPLTNGAKVVLKVKVVASVLAADRQTFYDWMHKHNFGSLVKRGIEVEFPRGDAKKAGKLLGYLNRWYKDYRVSDAESIHTGTMNAWARELQEKNLAAMSDGGKILEFPDVCKVTELKSSQVILPKGVTEL